MTMLRVLVLFVTVAVGANVGATWALPWVVNCVVTRHIVQRAEAGALQATTGDSSAARQRAQRVLTRDARNVALMAPPVDAASRTVVRPSPDLLYTACVFDLSRHALHLHAPVPDGYVSVSAYGADTGNFFARHGGAGGGAAPGSEIDVILAHGAVAHPPPGIPVVPAPSTRGLVLFRLLINDRTQLSRLRTLQAQQSCTPL